MTGKGHRNRNSEVHVGEDNIKVNIKLSFMNMWTGSAWLKTMSDGDVLNCAVMTFAIQGLTWLAEYEFYNEY